MYCVDMAGIEPACLRIIYALCNPLHCISNTTRISTKNLIN